MKISISKCSGSILSALMSAATLLGPGGFQASAGNFPNLGQEVNESTPSMGVFRVEITDPAMQALVNKGTYLYPYPGWITTGSDWSAHSLS